VLNLLGREVPSKNPTVLASNPFPLTKSVKAALPAVMLSGEIEPMDGVGTLPGPLEQLFSTRNAETSRTAAVHRKRIKKTLLKSFGNLETARARNPRLFTRGKPKGLRNRPTQRALELIASVAKAVNSDSRRGGMVGS
jgi:hypothetical protein